jgi:hypothetical protein
MSQRSSGVGPTANRQLVVEVLRPQLNRRGCAGGEADGCRGPASRGRTSPPTRDYLGIELERSVHVARVWRVLTRAMPESAGPVRRRAVPPQGPHRRASRYPDHGRLSLPQRERPTFATPLPESDGTGRGSWGAKAARVGPTVRGTADGGKGPPGGVSTADPPPWYQRGFCQAERRLAGPPSKDVRRRPWMTDTSR